jgi:alpha-glucosidase
MRFILALLALIFAPAMLHAQNDVPPPVLLDSPNKAITVQFWLNGEGRPGYAVLKGGKPVIAESRMGFILTDANKLERNFAIVSTKTRSFDQTWEQPWGEWRTIRNNYNEVSITLQEKSSSGRKMVVVFRAFDDGVGFRYEFPEQPNLKQVNIQEELTQFNVADAATAWWIPAMEWNREEYLYNTTPIEEVGLAQTPITIRTKDGLHVSFHEAALVDYSAMNIQKVERGLLKAVLTPAPSGPKVSRAAPFPTPWRTITIAENAPALYAAQLILNLNEPNKLGDVSWVRPRKYMGIWWGMHLDTQSWASGPKHGATTAYAKTMIDYAAKHGFSGLLIEGWNEGWDGDWFANGETFSFTKSYPDFDLKAVTDYGRKKGVTIIGHHETSAYLTHYEDQMEAGFALYQSVGVDTVKTGYVSDAGGMKVRSADGSITYVWHEGQASANHHLKVLEAAAKYKIAINAHEPIKDTGLRRTYPNWISREGARGMEYNAWAVPKNPPEHEVNLVFTRMLSGPMDYTPGVLSLRGRGDTPIPSTLARQLALYIVLYSPIQMAADLPENYDKHLGAFQFIKDVAVDWDDSRVLDAAMGDHVVMVRKERGKDRWYLGAISDEVARSATIKLDFLTPGHSYTAEIYRDSPDAHFEKNQFAIVIERKTVTAKDSMTLNLAAGGGTAIRFISTSEAGARDTMKKTTKGK